MTLSGTTRRGPLSDNRKNHLDPIKVKAKGQLLAKPWPCPKPPTLCLARGLARKASADLPNLRLARGLAWRASDGLPIFRLARGLTRKASAEEPILHLARGSRAYSLRRDADSPPRSRPTRQNNPVASASTNFLDKTSRPTSVFDRSRDISRKAARHSGVAD